MPIEEDFGRWVYWWEFNKDRFLRLKETLRDEGVTTASDDFFMGPGLVPEDPVRPGELQVRASALPALLAALEQTRNREITMACLMAIAKIARDFGQIDAVDVIEPYLARDDRAVRATAALALGICEAREATYKLVALLRDSPAGRALVGDDSVDDWTRAFSAYALGSLAHGADLDTKRSVFDQLRAVLVDESVRSRELRVATIQAIGAIEPGWRTSRGRLLTERAMHELGLVFRSDRGAGDEPIQAHAAQAIARLATGHFEAASVDYYKHMFLSELDRRDSRGKDIRRSALLALGVLCSPVEDEGSADLVFVERIWAARRETADQQESLFALAALGQIGGAWSRQRLLDVLRSGSKAIERPWAALGLGLMVREAQDERRAGAVDRLVTDRLRDALGTTKNPDAIASAAIALGLARCEDAVPDLRAVLARFDKRDLIAGCTCQALAMLGDVESIPHIQRIVDDSTRRPELLRRAAVALGLLRDRTAAPHLVELLRDDASYTGIASLSAAIALIGDSQTIEPLVSMLDDESNSKFARSMAAAAIGGIADRRLLPWNEMFAANVNYLASVATFAAGGYGVFEIL
ncbi:MAG: HEAT repeat domain-containing protein [Planctomycetes bacterium]|nr:HEAT repeat domain-containing protein [Planctomycetota bacterium]